MVALVQPVVTMSEAQAYVRIETGEEEAVLAGLVRSASALCEAFLGQVIIARPFTIDVPACVTWQRLSIGPVRAIDNVAGVDASGASVAFQPESYGIDIDSAGDGWVRVAPDDSLSRVTVSGTAGMALDQNEVPEPIRQGVLRLVAHLFTVRDGSDGEPPAAVTALWRPYRRLRVA
jgi:uncharacterized phiE125 gp8 family phage protein